MGSLRQTVPQRDEGGRRIWDSTLRIQRQIGRRVERASQEDRGRPSPTNSGHLKGRLEYRSPLDAEILKAWRSRGNDQETEVPKWIANGAPLGIEEPIGTCGIFPPATADDPHALDEAELMAEMQMARGDITNYKSVAEDLDNAAIELDRYKQMGYLVELTKEEVLETMGHGTISRLGLIVKEKPEGTKRRIIIDLRPCRRSSCYQGQETLWTQRGTFLTSEEKDVTKGQSIARWW